MYIPRSFSESTLNRLHELMEQESFALLVSISHAEGPRETPLATHLPLMLDRTTGTMGAIRGHLARANPQWKDLDGKRVLVVFSGPHCYISPSWYESDDVVPTWNYVAVHAVGCFELIEQPSQLREIVERMTDVYERTMPSPWKLSTDEYSGSLLSQIVGFQIVIESIEGKWKLNQNHSIERQQKVIHRLREHGGVNELAIAEFMEQNLSR